MENIPEIVTDTATLKQALAAVSSSDFVAIDTEFMRETTYYPQLCLIQVCANEVAFCIDPMSEGIDLTAFFEVLSDTSVMKVFHAGRQDLEIFVHLTGSVPAPVYDTQIAAMAFVYLAHLAAAWSLTPVLSPAKKKISLPSFGGAAVLSAVVFYAVSNATPIALGFYPNTVEGWMACYLAGLPFLLKGVLANVIFGGVAFTGIWLARKVANGDVARLTSSQ